MRDFEDFLMEKHAEQYIGTKDCMIDDYNDWTQELGCDDFIEYGDQSLVQLKSELVEKLPKEKTINPELPTNFQEMLPSEVDGFNLCLSQVKEIIRESLRERRRNNDTKRIGKISN